MCWQMLLPMRFHRITSPLSKINNGLLSSTGMLPNYGTEVSGSERMKKRKLNHDNLFGVDLARCAVQRRKGCVFCWHRQISSPDPTHWRQISASIFVFCVEGVPSICRGVAASVRWIVAIVLFLSAAVWLACDLESPANSAANHLLLGAWRRTTGGWERLVPKSPAPAATSERDLWDCHPHPVVMSLLVGMVSVMLLVAFSPGKPSYPASESTTPLPTQEASF
jgi:hypothetical protein